LKNYVETGKIKGIMMKKLALMMLILSTLTFAGDANELLRKVKEKFSEIKDFSAEINQEGNNPVFTGKMFYKKDDKFRLELRNMTIVSDGITIWNYNKKDNRVVIDETKYSESFPFSLDKLLNEYPSKSNLSSTTEGNFNILTLTPKPGSDLNFTRARLWINSDNLIERVFLESGTENKMDFRISGYKLNQALPDSRFTFNPPEGSRIIDLR
jgi:chaperone LolA